LETGFFLQPDGIQTTPAVLRQAEHPADDADRPLTFAKTTGADRLRYIEIAYSVSLAKKILRLFRTVVCCF
jgi:hypothetical protein